MKQIYEPEDAAQIPDSFKREPNIELIEGRLRLHFLPDGIAFGLIDPGDARFAALLQYEKAREIMLEEAEIQRESERR